MLKEEMRRRINLLEQLVRDYEIHHDIAIDELRELSQGLGVKPTWWKPEYGWEKAMAYKASLALVRIMKRPLRRV